MATASVLWTVLFAVRLGLLAQNGGGRGEGGAGGGGGGYHIHGNRLEIVCAFSPFS